MSPVAPTRQRHTPANVLSGLTNARLILFTCGPVLRLIVVVPSQRPYTLSNPCVNASVMRSSTSVTLQVPTMQIAEAEEIVEVDEVRAGGIGEQHHLQLSLGKRHQRAEDLRVVLRDRSRSA